MTAPPAGSVRCKFILTAVKTKMGSAMDKDGKWVPAKMYDLTFNPVSGTYDHEKKCYVNDENTRFWQATPSGEFRFDTINEDAAKAFEFGKEYYVVFTEAPKTPPS